MTRRTGWALVLLLVACAGDGALPARVVERDVARDVERDVVQAGLEALFVKRERAQAITLWSDGREFAPTLSVYGGRFDGADTLALWPVASATRAGLTLPLRVESTTLQGMEAFFRDEPAGWDAWFKANPGNAGIVEIVQPRITGDSAQLMVGRACGEQCRSAWRLSLVRGADRGWQVRAVDVLRVPR